MMMPPCGIPVAKRPGDKMVMGIRPHCEVSGQAAIGLTARSSRNASKTATKVLRAEQDPRAVRREQSLLMSPLILDGLIALLLAGDTLASLLTTAPAVIAIAAGGTLCITWRRTAPLTVLALSSGAFVVCIGPGYLNPPLPFVPLVAIYTVAAYRERSISIGAGGAAAIAVIAGSVYGPNGLNDDSLLDYPLSLVVALTIGCGVRVGRARAALLEEQSAQLAREHDERTERAIEQERARIARELHDIVAHHVSVIVAQAGAADVVFDGDPQQTRQALRSIGSVGREALVEMRRLVGVLHPDGTHAGEAPTPGLDGLPSLIDQIERAGLAVEVSIGGDRRRLPAGVELSAYRIIQEALTNSLKHAGPTRARVRLAYHEDFLELRISDAGRADDTRTENSVRRGDGRGLVGMQQRAALLGGYLDAGLAPGRGFVVTARLPVAGRPR
jgi:signal transduction histidine kinase